MEQDHVEALAMNAARTRARALPPPTSVPSKADMAETAAVGFALV
jgi:hypothetical protein